MTIGIIVICIYVIGIFLSSIIHLCRSFKEYEDIYTVEEFIEVHDYEIVEGLLLGVIWPFILIGVSIKKAFISLMIFILCKFFTSSDEKEVSGNG